MTVRSLFSGISILFVVIQGQAIEQINGRDSLVLKGTRAQLVVDLSGGSIASFQLLEQPLNPLSWNTPSSGDKSIHGFGHFLCLDRWGPPSEAEGKNGMPYHGEASSVPWTGQMETVTGKLHAELSATLPLAGLSIRRTLTMPQDVPFVWVQETVKNTNRLGRILNMVQHPSIAAPFLDASTLIDCNGRKGFAQGNPMPNPEEPTSLWPRAINRDGVAADIRHLTADHDPNVVSYVIDEALGWVTAVNPGKELLIGYVWNTSEYPWVSHWRNSEKGQPTARGLEFGTTGLHQPFPILTKKQTIFGRQLFEYLDANESRTKSYGFFLMKVPRDFGGVEKLTLRNHQITVEERSTQTPRVINMQLPKTLGLPPGLE